MSRRTVLTATGAGLVGLLGGTSATAATAGRGAGMAADHGPEEAASWLRKVYEIVASQGLTPPTAARTYAFVCVAMYESVHAGMPGYHSLGGQLNALGRLPRPAARAMVDWPSALTSAVEVVARHLLSESPTAQQAVSDHADARRALRRGAGVTATSAAASRTHGEAVGHAIVRWASSDGHAEAKALPYEPSVGESLWVPTPPNFGTAIEPHCARIRTMVLRSPDEVAPEPHVPFSTDPSSAFFAQAMATYRQGAANTDETRNIARFWTDNPTFSGLPAGHWLHSVVQAAEQHGFGLDRTVEALAMTGIALHDAFVNCWTWKYRMNLLRPVTYVRRHIDPTWSTLVNTPQFPEYTSGHSVASRAASTVLTALLGPLAYDDTTLATTVGIVTPTRHFADFHSAADEAAQSRIYGGIHFPMGIEAGKGQGDRVGEIVSARVRTRG